MPHVFAWFLLRPGYSREAKYWAFGWAAALVVLAGLGHNPARSSRADEPAFGGTVAEFDACAEALPVLEARCRLPSRDCVVGKTAISTAYASWRDTLGPGYLLQIRDAEWFLRHDGTLMTTNGYAMSWCEELPEVLDVVALMHVAAGRDRGADGRSYEGLFDKSTKDYLHADCSRFEMKVGGIVHRELNRDLDEDGDLAAERAFKIGSRRVGLPPKTVEDIYHKAVQRCPVAIQYPHLVDPEGGPTPGSRE